jgi:prepilin-type N-terminal cleavage/methylation domain-containing protein
MHPFSASAKKGFTLLEIMIAVVIIAVLAGMAIPGYFRTVEVGRSNEARTNLSVLHMGQKVFRLNNPAYWNPGGTTLAAANAALNLDMSFQNYTLNSVVGNAAGYTAIFQRNGANGGAGLKTFTATYPNPADPTPATPTMPPAITEGGTY